MTIFYRSESPSQPWMIKLAQDEMMKRHLVRIRLFQRVTTSRRDSITSVRMERYSTSRMDIGLDLAEIWNDSREIT